jgi:hypothetical protein
MPKTPKTVLKQTLLPFEVHTSGDPWRLDEENPATVPLPNDVIITEIEGSYTEKDRKLWAFLVAVVWDNLLTTRIHEIRVSKINAVFQAKGGDSSTSWIWESAQRLASTRVRWEAGVDADRLKGVANLLSAAVTHKDARVTGFLRFEIPALLCEVIRAPCRFSRLRLHFMIGLSGKYAVTLYMLLESVANRQVSVLEVSLEQLRQWLKVPDGKLEKWFDVKRRILEPALKQINDNPDAAGFSVVMEEFKEGRAVNRVRFTLVKTAERLEGEKNLRQKEKTVPVEPNGQIKPIDSDSLILPTSAYEQAKKVAPNLDIYFLENEWRIWIADKPKPNNPPGSFVGFCRSRYEKGIPNSK